MVFKWLLYYSYYTMADDDDGYCLDLYFALDEVTLESHRHLVPSNKDDELNHNNSSNKDDYEYDLSLFLSDDFPYDTTNTESTETIFKSPQKDKFEEKTERRENQQNQITLIKINPQNQITLIKINPQNPAPLQKINNHFKSLIDF